MVKFYDSETTVRRRTARILSCPDWGLRVLATALRVGVAPTARCIPVGAELATCPCPQAEVAPVWKKWRSTASCLPALALVHCSCPVRTSTSAPFSITMRVYACHQHTFQAGLPSVSGERENDGGVGGLTHKTRFFFFFLPQKKPPFLFSFLPPTDRRQTSNVCWTPEPEPTHTRVSCG